MTSNDDLGDKTEVLHGDQETLVEELKKAKEQDACLIIIRGTPQGHRFFLTENNMILGRDPSVDITVSDGSISKKHAKITKESGKIFLTDLGSLNGTLINGKKVIKDEPVALAKEDMIKLGHSILKFLPSGELEILFYGSLGSKAHTDPLTGIYNKRYLGEALGAEFKRAKALNSNLTLIYFDIDHFKKVNDTWGHDCGDYVLREVTALVKNFVGKKDVFARYGGEEFVILLSNTQIAQGQEVAEQIRRGVEGHPFTYDENTLKLTMSLGVAHLSDRFENPDELIKAADKALYAAKNGGRNRVKTAPS